LRWVRDEAELGLALAAPLPPVGPRRGPFPRGLEAILTDIHARLEGAAG
jgi:hypothetical protein